MLGDARLFFIFTTLAIDAMGLGIVIPVLPNVVGRFVEDKNLLILSYGMFMTIYALLQFASSPLLGRLSDYYGRRPVLLISLFGATLDYALMALAPSLFWLFVGRAISGISGASYTVASAYASDISTEENRSRNFGVLGAGFGLGFIIGPAVGGYLADLGPVYPFIIASVLNFMNFIFGYFILPESLSKENRRPFSRDAMNPLRGFAILKRIHGMGGLVTIFFLFQLAGQTHPSIWALYTQRVFSWSPSQIGASLTVVGIMTVISQGFLTAKLVRLFGEPKVALYGCLGEGISFMCFAFAFNSLVLYTTLILGSVFWAATPALQSLISKKVPTNEQGELQGALMSLVALTTIISPLLSSWLFALTSDINGLVFLPGSPYLAGSLLLFAAFGFGMRILNVKKS